MTTDLPDFEGTIPVGVVTRITGTGKRITRALHYGERLLVLAEVIVDNVAHAKTSDGMTHVHRLAVEDLYELTGDDGRDLLRACRSAYRTADDEAHGRNPLAFNDTAQPAQYVTDGGSIMTAAEIAAKRGEAYDPDGDILAVGFSDGTKGLWPDDWAGTGQELASVGGTMRFPKGEPGEVGQVVLLLNVDSGDTVAEWTVDDELERSRAAEAAALSEEARADREAAEDLERARDTDSPWSDHDDVTMAVLKVRIRALDDLDTLLDAEVWERAHKARKGVLVAVADRRAVLTATDDGSEQ